MPSEQKGAYGGHLALLSFDMVNKRLETSDDLDVSQKTSNYRREAFGVPSACR